MSKKSAVIRYIIALCLFGTIGMLLRHVILPSEIVVLGRGVFGSLFIRAFLMIRNRKPDRTAIQANRRILLISGIMLGLNWIFLFAAYRATTVAIASLCDYMAPVMIIFLSPFLFHEKLTWKKMLCVAAALAGIVLVSGVTGGDASAVNIRGILYGLAAAVCFVGIIICNKYLTDISSYDRALVQLAVSVLVVLPYVILVNFGKTIPFDTRSILLTAVIGLIQTGFAYILYFGAMGDMSVQSVAILGYIEPVVSVLTSALVLQEPLSVSGRIGAVLILGAAIISETVE